MGSSGENDPTGAVSEWSGDKAGLWMLLGGAAAMMHAFVAARRRRPARFEPRPKHKFDWYGCGIDGCGKLVPPKRLMCIDHWIQVPVSLRMQLVALAKANASVKPGSEAVTLMREAILFVENEERERAKLQREVRYPTTKAWAALWKTLSKDRCSGGSNG